MKTAMQLAFERIELMKDISKDDTHWQMFKEHYLEKEKEQIINAHLDGMYKLAIALNEFLAIKNTMLQIEKIKNGVEKHDNGLDYYNETYQNK